MSSSIQPLDLDAEESPSVSHHALVVMNMDILEPPPTTVAERHLLVFGKPSTELCHSTTTILFSFWRLEHQPTAPSRIVHSWGHGLTVMQFSGSQITRLSTVHGRRHSSIDHFVCNAPARALLTSPRVDRQTAVADHFVIRTSIPSRGSRTTPCSSCSNHIPPSLSRSNRSNCYIQLLGCASRRCNQTTLTLTQTSTN
ncbi:hypothetical protein BASA83_007351 [Batrachochytrium salamandrivorans]|nr:hypothetical protein BASA83_007351 [Batrachochytrium salamandrivorans]